MTDSLDIKTYDSGVTGTHLLILGAIHGDERCGALALGTLCRELDDGLHTLQSGKITIVPVCNPKAYEQDCRYIDVNLNRVIGHHQSPVHYEHHLANQIAPLIEQADVLLDLHAYSSGTKPFLFLDHETPQSRAFATSLGIPDWVTGWEALYEPKEQETTDCDTEAFAHRAGKMALTIECGQLKDPASTAIARQAALAALAHFDIVKTDNLPAPITAPRLHKMHKIIFKNTEGKFVKNWQHLDEVKAGEPLISCADGTIIKSDTDGVVMLPCEWAAMGTEWLYLGCEA